MNDPTWADIEWSLCAADGCRNRPDELWEAPHDLGDLKVWVPVPLCGKHAQRAADTHDGRDQDTGAVFWPPPCKPVADLAASATLDSERGTQACARCGWGEEYMP